jgi:3-oxoacyl-(acyl-carrier-protein) synthase
MRGALDDAGMSAADIAFVNAHGTGTKVNDTSEAAAIEQVFGKERPAVMAIKSSVGHMQGAAGVFSAVSTALSLREKLLPPIANFAQPDEGVDLDFVTGGPRPLPTGAGLFNAFGFGGVSATLVLAPVAMKRGTS